jgi:hypothetical protein
VAILKPLQNDFSHFSRNLLFRINPAKPRWRACYERSTAHEARAMYAQRAHAFPGALL